MLWRRASEADYLQGSFDALKARAPQAMQLIASMIQTSGQLEESGRPTEALKLATDARRAFTDFDSEVREVSTELATDTTDSSPANAARDNEELPCVTLKSIHGQNRI